MIHLATHGRFSGTAERSYIQASDEPIYLDQLEAMLRRAGADAPVALLVLSACQTAAGNNRSFLGLAGVGLRAGVTSIVGSLWHINDEIAAQLIIEFYRHLSEGKSKAEALRQAQLKQLKKADSHGAFWSAFVLLGGWE